MPSTPAQSELHDRSPVACVTGSSSGIGQAAAVKLARAGYSLILHGRHNLAGLTETAKLVRQVCPSVELRAITSDISCPQACQQLAQAAFAWKGRVDTWVNCAGADVLTGSASKLSFDAKLSLLLSVDVAGTIRISRLVASQMQAAAGQGNLSIINIGWDQAYLGMEGEPGQMFGPCKSAVEAFTKSLALTHGGAIRVNCVSPGWIRTAWGSQDAGDRWNRRATRESLAGRWGTPDDVAQVIQWLASPAAQFINGQIICANGGRRYFTEPT